MPKKKITVPVGAKFNPERPWQKYFGGITVYLSWERLDNLIKEFNRIKESYPEYEDLEIRDEEEHGSMYYYIYGTRLETDEEYECRKKEEREREKEVEKSEKLQLAILKKKYGE